MPPFMVRKLKKGRFSFLTMNGIYLSRTSLDVAFDDNGRQINPLMVRLTGNVAGVVKLLNRCGRQAESAQDTTLPHQFMLVASRVAL